MKINWTVIIMLFPFACIAQKQENDWEKESLVGKVKILRYSTARDTNELTALRLKPFNKNLYSVDSFSNKGYKLLSYEVRNGIVEATVRITYKFDSMGNIIEQFANYEGNKMPIHTTFKYDAGGKLLERKNYDEYGRLFRLIKYFYSSGHIIKEEDSINQGIQKTVYEYNAKWQVEKETFYNIDGRESTVKYTYDNDGNKMTEFAEGFNLKKKFKYDYHKNKILTETIDSKRVKYSYITEYVYDKKGNWIRCIDDTRDDYGYGENLPSYILTVREIMYY